MVKRVRISIFGLSYEHTFVRKEEVLCFTTFPLFLVWLYFCDTKVHSYVSKEEVVCLRFSSFSLFYVLWIQMHYKSFWISYIGREPDSARSNIKKKRLKRNKNLPYRLITFRNSLLFTILSKNLNWKCTNTLQYFCVEKSVNFFDLKW